MRVGWIMAGLLACGGVAAGAVALSPVQALAGRYSHHFRNGTVDGDRYWSDDVVEVVPVDARHAYVRFSLQFFNGHSCGLAGVAQAQGDALVYRETAASPYGGHCTVTLRRAGDKLRWDTPDGACQQHCGARGGMIGDVPWSSRRPIAYLARLKASPDYHAALQEFRAR